MAQQRIGIYAGTFNPVHAGHIAFALQAIDAAKLDKLYFLPERHPRHKKGVEHFGHRIAMLDRALEPHPKLTALEMPDINFSVQRTIPRLRRLNPEAQLVFLFGSEVATTIPDWAYSKQLLGQAELVVGMRTQQTAKGLQREVGRWLHQPVDLHVVETFSPTVSSTRIREALRLRKPVQGLLASVARYSDRNWLYVSLA
jgi:nicotinate-nucleotide adenylyltransferase